MTAQRTAELSGGKMQIASPGTPAMFRGVRCSSTSIARPLWLAACACVVALVSSSHAVESFQYKSGKIRNQPLPEQKSIKLQKPAPIRVPAVSPPLKGKNDIPARYSRKNNGSLRFSR
jgi:hypothetical protein